MSALELLLRRDRWLVIGALTMVVVLAWITMLAGAGMSMAPMAWTPGYAMLVFLMWWIMMVAMMLPSASPVILLFANVSRRQQALGKPLVTFVVDNCNAMAWRSLANSSRLDIEQWRASTGIP